MLSKRQEFEREFERRATKAAETLKYIILENLPSALTCCEGWDEAIQLVRDLLLELNLKPQGIPLEHLSMKNMVDILKVAFKNKQ